MKNNYFKTLLTAVLVIGSYALFAQNIAPAFLQKQWSAKWVSVPNTDGSKYGVYLFRKSFGLNTKPANFPIYISADNRYKLYVNGTIEVNYQLENSKWKVEIMLPKIKTSTLVWKGKNKVLKEGKNSFLL